MVVLGLALFTVVGEAAEGRDNAPANEWAIVAGRWSRSPPWCCSSLGGRGSLGRKAALYRRSRRDAVRAFGIALQADSRDLPRQRSWATLQSWEFYAFAVSGIVAFVVQQVSLATGLLATSVATVSVFNPLVSIVIGTILLQERLSEPTWHKLIAYGGLALALVGAVAISRATEGEEEDGSDKPRPVAVTRTRIVASIVDLRLGAIGREGHQLVLPLANDTVTRELVREG